MPTAAAGSAPARSVAFTRNDTAPVVFSTFGCCTVASKDPSPRSTMSIFFQVPPSLNDTQACVDLKSGPVDPGTWPADLTPPA